VGRMKTHFKKGLVWYLVGTMLVIGMTPRVYAGFSPSEGIGLSQIDRSSDLKKVQQFLEMKMVRERFKELGFTPEEIQARLSEVDDQQIHQLALKLDDLKVGGDGAGVVVAVLVIILLIIVLVWLLQHRIVIK
jgi:hypothetical protein